MPDLIGPPGYPPGYVGDLLMLVPSRGRPDRARELVETWRYTAEVADLVFVLDEDDYHRYEVPVCERGYGQLIAGRSRGGMVWPLNYAIRLLAETTTRWRAVGFLGDDHRPRTVGWDTRMLAALDEMGAGMVYGNDLIHGAGLPTAIAMTADIPQALGWMAPPTLRHLFVDNAWLALGRRANCIRYLPDVVIEHMHPLVGKAPTDEGYERVNAPEIATADRAAFETWCADPVDGLAYAAAVIQSLRGAEVGP